MPLVGLVAGLAADRIGRHAMLKFGLIVLGCGSAIGLFAQGVPMLLASRVVEASAYMDELVKRHSRTTPVSGAGRPMR